MKQTISINLDELNIDYLLKNNFKYALIYYLNDIVLGKIEDINYINKDILVEAMFFNEDKELHFFEDNEFNGVLIEKESSKEVKIHDKNNVVNEGDVIYEKYLLKKRLGRDSRVNKYKRIEVANYLGYADDGQAYVKATCLSNLEEV